MQDAKLASLIDNRATFESSRLGARANSQAIARALEAEGINASSTWFTQDAVGGGGWGVGEFTVVVTALGPVAVVQLRKLVEAFLKIREGRKLKLKYGPLTLEGRAEDVEKLATPEQIAKMLDGPKESREKNKP